MPADSHLVRQAGRTAVITLPDQIDITNAAWVRAALQRPLAEGAAVLVADLTGTSYCACAGVAALLNARQATAAAGAVLRMAVSSDRPMVWRVLELTGADQLIGTYPTVQAALTAPGEPAGGGRDAWMPQWR